jgi:hypothetical protein
MPLRTLRFCPRCLLTLETSAQARCGACDEALLPLFDDSGALSKAFLTARGNCCDSGCRNCPYPRQKTCEKCGREFACMKNACWCEDVQLSAQALQSLRQTCRDCVCPACLSALAENQQTMV